jgi:hypothetical protein
MCGVTADAQAPSNAKKYRHRAIYVVAVCSLRQQYIHARAQGVRRKRIVVTISFVALPIACFASSTPYY